MPVYSQFPALEDFCLVVCHICSKAVTPQGIFTHYGKTHTHTCSPQGIVTLFTKVHAKLRGVHFLQAFLQGFCGYSFILQEYFFQMAAPLNQALIGPFILSIYLLFVFHCGSTERAYICLRAAAPVCWRFVHQSEPYVWARGGDKLNEHTSSCVECAHKHTQTRSHTLSLSISQQKEVSGYCETHTHRHTSTSGSRCCFFPCSCPLKDPSYPSSLLLASVICLLTRTQLGDNRSGTHSHIVMSGNLLRALHITEWTSGSNGDNNQALNSSRLCHMLSHRFHLTTTFFKIVL